MDIRKAMNNGFEAWKRRAERARWEDRAASIYALHDEIANGKDESPALEVLLASCLHICERRLAKMHEVDERTAFDAITQQLLDSIEGLNTEEDNQ